MERLPHELTFAVANSLALADVLRLCLLNRAASAACRSPQWEQYWRGRAGREFGIPVERYRAIADYNAVTGSTHRSWLALVVAYARTPRTYRALMRALRGDDGHLAEFLAREAVPPEQDTILSLLIIQAAYSSHTAATLAILNDRSWVKYITDDAAPSILYAAVIAGNEEVVRKVLEWAHPTHIENAIYVAIEEQQRNILSILLDRSAQVDEKPARVADDLFDAVDEADEELYPLVAAHYERVTKGKGAN